MSWWLDITELDEDQKDVIALPPTGDYLILGPPGSGKTNLLLIRAEYLIRSDQPNIYVLMFNDPLHDFVVRGGAQYELPPAKIRKILSWEFVLLRENGIDFGDLPEEDFFARRQALAGRVLGLLDANPNLEHHLDCLFVDEIQDCISEEVEVFFRCAKHVCFAGDGGQRIFNDQNVIPMIQERVQTIELTTHYRIGHEICRVADVIGKNAGLPTFLDTCNYRGPDSKVQFFNCRSNEEQIKKIIEALNVQLTAYPGELLAVAGPRKQDHEYLRAMLEASPLAPYILPHRNSGSENSSQCIYLANLFEIKGLEFRTIHLALMQYISRVGPNQKRIAYTGITRAKTTAAIYYDGNIPGYLEQAMSVIEPPKPKPPLRDLFPKKKKDRK